MTTNFYTVNKPILSIGVLLFGTIVISGVVLAQSAQEQTSTPAAQATQLALKKTRTAIAVTRDPFLATPRTPAPIQLTATVLTARLAATSTKEAQPEIHNNFMQTATAVIAHVTETSIALTANPDLALTPLPTFPPPDCNEPALANYAQSALALEIQEELQRNGLPDTFVDVVTYGISQGSGCKDFSPLETTFVINVPVDGLSIRYLSALIRHILSVLDKYPSTEDLGLEPARLIISMRYEGTHQFVVDTGYENARKAFRENLSEVEFLEALGVIID